MGLAKEYAKRMQFIQVKILTSLRANPIREAN
jgi:hypothetical protein